VSGPAPAADPADLERRFAEELAAAAGTPHRGADPVAVALAVVGATPVSIAVDDDADLDVVAHALDTAGHQIVRPHDPSFRERLPHVAVGVTRCTAAIAETGTLLLTFDEHHPRATSLLPRTHLALVHAEDLVVSLADALARIPSPAPSAVTFVTGPSRSADIEQILTLGVHGPAQVHVVLP
jgi:L-lactate utilization protein LutC